MGLTLKCLIFITLTSASAFNQRDFRSARSLNPQRSRPDINQLNNHNYRSRYLEEPPPDRPNEQQRMNERSIAVNSGVQRVQELEIKRLQTRNEDISRAENRSYYNIVNVHPEPYPVIANRRDVSYDDLEIPKLVPSYQRYVPDIPENCKKLGICDKINNYPHDVVNRIFKEFILNNSRSKARAIVGALTGHYATGTIKLTLDPGCRACGEEEETMEHLYCVTAMSWWVNLTEKSKNRLKVEVPKKTEIETREGGEDKIELCKLNETVVFPQAAQAENGKWYVILNPDVVKLQGFRINICQTRQCSYLVEFPYGYTARCKQKYMQRAMAAVDVDKREIIYDKTFRVPSCCSCVTSPYY